MVYMAEDLRVAICQKSDGVAAYMVEDPHMAICRKLDSDHGCSYLPYISDTKRETVYTYMDRNLSINATPQIKN